MTEPADKDRLSAELKKCVTPCEAAFAVFVADNFSRADADLQSKLWRSFREGWHARGQRHG